MFNSPSRCRWDESLFASPQATTGVGYVGAGRFLHITGDRNQIELPRRYPRVFQEYDISLRQEGSFLLANGLSDLTNVKTVFCIVIPRYWIQIPAINQSVVNTIFPYVLESQHRFVSDAVLAGDRAGEDVVIRNVLSFDVRVFDPQQAVDHGTGAVLPPDYTDLVQSRPQRSRGQPDSIHNTCRIF